jgi:hypothetical protein
VPPPDISTLAEIDVELARFSLSRSAPVRPTAMPLTCPRAFICRERSGRSPRRTRRFSAGPAYGTRSGAAACWTALQQCTDRRCAIDTLPMHHPPVSVAGAATGRTARRELSAREAARLSATRTTGASVAAGDRKSLAPCALLRAYNLRHALQRFLKSALACGGCAAARHFNSGRDRC